jgi:uncharacterized protein (DUF2126 family)
VRELSYLHSRDITFAVFGQGRNVTYDTPPAHPYDESVRYRDFTGWDMPWYSAHASLDTLLAGREIGPMAQWPRIEAGRSDDLTRSPTLYTQRGRNVRAE